LLQRHKKIKDIIIYRVETYPFRPISKISKLFLVDDTTKTQKDKLILTYTGTAFKEKCKFRMSFLLMAAFVKRSNKQTGELQWVKLLA
jgi:hypothetical protein